MKKVALVSGFLLVAIVSAALGIGATLLYLAKPFQKWQVEFSETYLPIQVEALQQLRSGNSERAERYLEMASTHSLVSMGEQKSEGAKVPTRHASVEAIKYLCAQPPTKASLEAKGDITFAEACGLLAKP